MTIEDARGRLPVTATVAFAALVSLCTPGLGQTRTEPRLILSLFGGVAAGADLWEVNRQPLLALGTELAPRYDTLRISRRVRPGLLLGISGALFRSAHVGVSGEMVFLALSTEDVCNLVYESPGADPLGRNAQTCSDIGSHSAATTVAGFLLGARYRLAPRAFASPYARVQAGLGARSGSVIETIGRFFEGGVQRQRVVINDVSKNRLSASAGAAVGLTVPAGPGYHVHLELRDQIVLLNRVTGPADDRKGAVAPTETFPLHSIGLSAGLDIVLEQKRGRRY